MSCKDYFIQVMTRNELESRAEGSFDEAVFYQNILAALSRDVLSTDQLKLDGHMVRALGGGRLGP